MKKIFLITGLLTFFPSLALAADIHFSADKNSLTTDDVVRVHLSVDGQIDNGQVGIEGLDDFALVGQQSSSQVEVVKGQTSMVQEKIFSLQPKNAGNFSLQAIAYENGKKIESDKLPFTVAKSLVQETKDKLLSESAPDNKATEQNNPQTALQNTNPQIQSSASEDAKNLLTTSPPVPQEAASPATSLNIPALGSFPKVEHLSAFNAVFWLEFSGIICLLLGFIGGVILIGKKGKVIH